MKLKKPIVEVIRIDKEDIIVTSGGCKGDCQEVCSNYCIVVTLQSLFPG